jgi:hypothetical protein
VLESDVLGGVFKQIELTHAEKIKFKFITPVVHKKEKFQQVKSIVK